MIVFLILSVLFLAAAIVCLSVQQNKMYCNLNKEIAKLKADAMSSFTDILRLKDEQLSMKKKQDGIIELLNSKEAAISDLEGKVKSNGEILVLLSKEIDHLHHTVRILCFSHTYELAMVQRAETGEYPEEFKIDCVKFVKEEGKSLRESARLLNIPKSTIADWIAKYNK